MFLCVRARAWARACVCVRVCMCGGGDVNALARACACLLVPYATRSRHICLRPLWLPHIFRDYLISGTIFGTKVTEQNMCVLIFSTNFIWSISHSKKNSARCDKCKNVFMQRTRYFCRILMELDFCRQVLEKSQILHFINIRPVGVELFHADGLTDGRTCRS